MHSEAAERLLAALHAADGGVLYVTCASTRIHEARWDLMKLIRDLIWTGDVLCRYEQCRSCYQVELVMTLRAPSQRTR